MFSIKDVKGIQLSTLIQYIVEHGKEQKQNQIPQGESYDMTEQGQFEHDDFLSQQESVQQDVGQEKNQLQQSKQEQLSSNEPNQSQDIMLTKVQNEQQQDYNNKVNNNKVTKRVTFIMKQINIQLLQQLQPTIKKDKTQNRRKPPSMQQLNMKSIMLSLRNNTIDHLKEQFICNDNKILLQRFLWLMRQCITYDKRRQYEIMYELIKLFEEIDIDCNQFIDWNQFLEYMACYGWAGDSQENYGDQSQLQQNGQREKKPNYIVQTWNQINKHRKNTLSKIVQIQKLDMLCLVESRNFTLSFLNTKGEKYTINYDKKNTDDKLNITNSSQTKDSNIKINQTNQNQQFLPLNKNKISTNNKEQSRHPFSLNHIDHKKVLSIDYSQHEKLFGVLQTDRKVYFVEEGQMQKSWGRMEGSGNQIDVMYLPLHRKWLLKRIDQYLDIFTSPKDKYNVSRITFKPHDKQSITAIKEIKQPLSLITSGIDGKIKIWNLMGKQLLIELRPVSEQANLLGYQMKTKGVKGLDSLNVGIQSYFCSWTFTTQIMLWLPSASISKPYIGKFQGHSGIVQSCQFVKPQHCSKQLLISMDNKQVIKLWSVQKMQCLQSIMHEGVGCQVKCLNGGPVFLVYQRVIEFNRLRLNSLMLSSQKQSTLSANSNNNSSKPNNNSNKNKQKNDSKQSSNHLQVGDDNYNINYNITPQLQLSTNNNNQQMDSQFVQLQFCNHNILMLLLLNTELRVINLRTGRVQHIVQPWLKDQEEFVSMALKINRRVFILSTLGYLYYVKVDGGMIIKRIKVAIGVNGMDELNLVDSNDLPKTFFEGRSKLKKLPTPKQKPNTKKNTPIPKTTTKPPKHSYVQNHQQHIHHFIPKFIHYHKQSKTLLVIVQLQQSSMLITYDESNAYQFEKMKQIQFPLIDLKWMFFFQSIDVMLVVNENSVVMWDWRKLNVMNCIHVEEEYEMEKAPVWPYIKIDDKAAQQLQHPFIKHITIYQHKAIPSSPSQPIYLILLIDKHQQLILYDIDPYSCQIKSKLYLTVHNKLKPTIQSFCLISTTNEELESKNRLVENTNVSNSSSQSGSVVGNQQNKLQYNNYHIETRSNNNSPTKYSQNIINANYNINNNSINSTSSSNQLNTFLYLTTINGLILIYTFNQLLQYIKSQSEQKHHNKKQKRTISNNKQIITNAIFSNNNDIIIQNENNGKTYAAHRIRENRKAAMRRLISDNVNQFHKVKSFDIQQYLIVEKQAIKYSWSNIMLKQLYKDIMCGVSQRQDVVLFKVTGEVVGEWNVRSMIPKRWSLRYQMLPTVLRRLNQLQSILKHQNQQSKTSNKRIKLAKSISTTYGLQTSKILFLANRFLQQKDLTQLLQQIQHDSTKSINSSKILYPKLSLKQDDLQKAQNVININIKKPKDYTKEELKTSIKYPPQSNNPSSSSLKLSTQANKLPKQLNEMTSSIVTNKGKTNNPINIKNNNFFEQKFQQKIQQENKLKINKMFLHKEVEKTLDHAKKLQLKTIENIKIKERYSLNAQAIKNVISKQSINENKQQPTTNHTIPLNTFTSKFPIFQTNQLQVQQQLQKQQIQKNIDFVKRIEDSIQKIQMNYTNGWTKSNKGVSDVGSDKRWFGEQKGHENNSQRMINGVINRGGSKQEGNKVQYERNAELSQTAKEAHENRKVSWKSSKPKRSFSAANHFTFASTAQKFTTTKTRPVSPARKHLKTFANLNQNPPMLIKSRSLYGTQFNKQKQFAVSNFKQGLRQLETFYKKFGPDINKTSDANKKNRIKLS